MVDAEICFTMLSRRSSLLCDSHDCNIEDNRSLGLYKYLNVSKIRFNLRRRRSSTINSHDNFRPTNYYLRCITTMWNDGLPVKELTLPLLLVSGYSAVRYSPLPANCLNTD